MYPSNMTEEQFSIRTQFTLLASTGRREFKARLVRAGRIMGPGKKPSNVTLDPAALEAAVTKGMFEGKAIFIDHGGMFDHPSVKNLAGVTHSISWNSNDQAVEGTISFYDSADHIVSLIDEILSDKTPPDIGLSLVFWPKWAPRDNDADLRRIVEVLHVESIDLVFEPAADGRILQALSTYFVSQGEPQTMTATPETPIPTPPAPDPLQMWLPALAKTAIASMISTSGLPAAAQDRLRASSYTTPGEVDAAIEAEQSYLASLTEAQVINIGQKAPRGSHIQVGMDAIEKINLALTSLIEGVAPPPNVAPLSGIREAYILLSGDYEMTGMFHGERMQFANVTSATMAGLVANALNKAVINEFQQYPRWWEKIATPMDFSTLQTVKWITLGGVGELPTVAEGAAYTELTWDDQTESATFVKKGGYLGLTLEAIDKDETRKLQAAPRALAQAAWLTLSKAISYIFTQVSGTGPTMSDNAVLFHSTHGANVVSTALSLTAWSACRLAMRKQTELNSGERLGTLTAPKYLLVPPDLEITAIQILASENDYLYALSNGVAAPPNVHSQGDFHDARMNFARDRVIVVDLWTDATDWAAVADPRMYPSIGLGYRYGRTPEIFSVASPTAGLMFTNDTLPIKVRFFFACGPTDWRGLYKANVA